MPHVLLNCISIIHGLFSSVVKFWEQDREPRTTATPSHLYASVQIIAIMRKVLLLIYFMFISTDQLTCGLAEVKLAFH